MDVVVIVLCVVQKKEKRVERVGVGGRGKYPGAPPHHLKKELADRKVPDRPEGESCEKKN
jgi:hypothetical protein